MMPRLLERAGRTPQGSITGFYSVLVEGDDPNEPIADTVRGLLDGHTWLSRKLAAKSHYPAIDVLDSISRLMTEITPEEHRSGAQVVRELLSAYRDHEDLISIGAYRRGSNRLVDLAIDMQAELSGILRQRIDERSSVAQAAEALNLLRQKVLSRPATQIAASA
jgi:flagellum-specific ATP synthase